MADYQGSRHSSSDNSGHRGNGSSRSGKFSRNRNDGQNRRGGSANRRGSGHFNSDRRRDDGEERRFDRAGANRDGGNRGGRGGRGDRSEGRRYRSDDRRDNRRYDRDDNRGTYNREERSERRYEKNDKQDYRSGRRFDRDGQNRRGGRDDRRDNRRDNQRGNYSEDRRGGERSGRGGNFRDDRRNSRGEDRNPRYNSYRDGDDRRENRADGRGDRRSGFSNQRGNHNGRQSSANYDNPRRNSDGTLSFPSQNPYTDRRPDEPKMPKGLDWSMLSTDEKERLRGLSKEHAENIGLHMLAAYALEEEDPQAAMEHAQWVARQASRVDVSRETLAFVAYRQGNYKLALREFRTAYRMNGYGDYLPFMADCERGLGNPQKAVDIALSDDAKQLQGEAKAELFLVYAGALADLDLFDKAIEIVHTIAHAQGVGGAYRMRAVQAEQNFLELAGREKEAAQLDDLLDRLESQYADVDDLDEDDVYVDNDLEFVDEDMLEGLGIDPREMSQYLPSNNESELQSSDMTEDAQTADDVEASEEDDETEDVEE